MLFVSGRSVGWLNSFDLTSNRLSALAIALIFFHLILIGFVGPSISSSLWRSTFNQVYVLTNDLAIAKLALAGSKWCGSGDVCMCVFAVLLRNLRVTNCIVGTRGDGEFNFTVRVHITGGFRTSGGWIGGCLKNTALRSFRVSCGHLPITVWWLFE